MYFIRNTFCWIPYGISQRALISTREAPSASMKRHDFWQLARRLFVLSIAFFLTRSPTGVSPTHRSIDGYTRHWQIRLSVRVLPLYSCGYKSSVCGGKPFRRRSSSVLDPPSPPPLPSPFENTGPPVINLVSTHAVDNFRFRVSISISLPSDMSRGCIEYIFHREKDIGDDTKIERRLYSTVKVNRYKNWLQYLRTV